MIQHTKSNHWTSRWRKAIQQTESEWSVCPPTRPCVLSRVRDGEGATARAPITSECFLVIAAPSSLHVSATSWSTWCPIVQSDYTNVWSVTSPLSPRRTWPCIWRCTAPNCSSAISVTSRHTSTPPSTLTGSSTTRTVSCVISVATPTATAPLLTNTNVSTTWAAHLHVHFPAAGGASSQKWCVKPTYEHTPSKASLSVPPVATALDTNTTFRDMRKTCMEYRANLPGHRPVKRIWIRWWILLRRISMLW